jgi:hypothetical protein
VWRQSKQSPAFGAGLENQMQVAVLEIPHAAMHESRRATRGPAREIVLLDEGDTQSAQRRVARDAATGNAAADDEQIERPIAPRELRDPLRTCSPWRSH